MLYFLKLGGSLITDKNRPRTVRHDTLARLAGEIAAALISSPGLKLVVGHGSGSFGHMEGKKHGTRQGVHNPEQWRGFVEVFHAARQLNQAVLEALHAAGLPVIAFPPSAAVTSRDGKVDTWDLAPLQAALQGGLVPLVNGDVIFDQQRGGTILSTEELFNYLAHHLHPQRILLAGMEEGVWADFPACTRLVEKITPQGYNHVKEMLGSSAAVDVTGGMLEKVKTMLVLSEQDPGFEALIFSGERPGLVRQALEGSRPGTMICQQSGG